MILKNGKRLDGMGDSMPIGSIVEYNGTDIPDGWEILPGDANVYIGSTEPTEGQEVWIQKGKNLFDKNSTVRGEAYGINGIYVENINWSRSFFIKVKPNTYYTIQATLIEGQTESQFTLAFWDSNRVWISENYTTNLIETVITPENCEYVTVQYRNDTMENIQLEIGSEATSYESYINKKVYIKNEDGGYDEFINKRNMGTLIVDNVVCKNIFEETLNKKDVTTAYTSMIKGNFSVEKGETYVISFDTVDNGGYLYLNESIFTSATRAYCNGARQKLISQSAVTGTYFNETLLKTALATSTPYDICNIMIERGSVATDYVKHKDFDNEHIYTTGERRIGTWVNGKPIYRKCFTLDTRIALGNGHTKMTTLAEQGIVNWEDITRISFIVKDDHAGYFSDGFYTDETDASRCWISSDWVMFLCGTTYGCGDTTFIIEYTKTTD